MTIELTNEEKATIINSHMKNLAYNNYNLNVSLVEENAKSELNQVRIDSLNADIVDTNAQLAALQKQLDALSVTPAPSN